MRLPLPWKPTEKEMILNGRIISTIIPLGIRQWTHCVPSCTCLCVVFQVSLASKPYQYITSTYTHLEGDIRYTSQVTYANPRNSKEFRCGFPWIATWPTVDHPHPVRKTSMLCSRNVCAASAECLCSVCGTSVLHPQNISVLYAAYLGSDWWTLRILCYICTRAQRKTLNESGH